MCRSTQAQQEDYRSVALVLHPLDPVVIVVVAVVVGGSQGDAKLWCARKGIDGYGQVGGLLRVFCGVLRKGAAPEVPSRKDRGDDDDDDDGGDNGAITTTPRERV